jgi:hypothetical protein
VNEAASPPASTGAEERRRILAARGWETERERAAALRELLAEPLPHIFLFSYSQIRHRDRALQHTRDLLVWLSRNLADVPEGRPLDHWIFERLATEGPTKLPLRLSELGPEPTQVLTEPPNEQYLQSYPTSHQFRDAYHEYRRLPADETLRSRAGWGQAERDLTHFVQGHFSEEGADVANARVPIRHRVKRTLKPGRVIPIALFAAAIGWILVLRHENAGLREQLASLAVSPDGERPAGLRAVGPAQITERSSDLVLTWPRALGADLYSVVVASEKMDTLWVGDSLRAARCTIPFAVLPPGRHFLYRIDAWAKDQRIASSGFVAYPAI